MSHARKPAACRFEALEDRHLLAITTQLLDGGATLRIVGDSTSESVVIAQDDYHNTITVSWSNSSPVLNTDLPQPVQTFQSSSITKVVVELNGGNDQLQYHLSSDSLDWIKTINVDLGSGNDTAFFDFGGLLYNIMDGVVIPPVGLLGGEDPIPPYDPEPANLNVNLRIDVNGGNGNDTVDAIFGNVNSKLSYRLNGGAGQDSLSSTLAGHVNTGRVANFDLSGGDGKDTLYTYLGQEGVAQGGNISVFQRGGNGDDIMSVQGYNTVIHGRVAIRQFGGNGNDTIESTVVAHWISEGRVVSTVTGENGNDRVVMRLKRDPLPPYVDLFRPLENFLVSAIAHGGSGRNQAWLTPNVRSMFNKVEFRAWDQGFPVPIDPWPF